MRILNFGSLNIDHVYDVNHLVRPGETISSRRYRRLCGGKGLNQSIALSHAGAQVYHAGKIGKDGLFLKNRLEKEGVDTSYVSIAEGVTGHAIIQVDRSGENSIVLYGGTNRQITKKELAQALSGFSPGEYVLLQNEISAVPEIMRLASSKGLRIAFNPAPMDPEVSRYPLNSVDYFILNETEGAALTDEKYPENILSQMLKRFPDSAVILTLGNKGAVYGDLKRKISVPARRVKPVDTTAAGDTFIGYFLAELIHGNTLEKSIRNACTAAAYCVTVEGAADSIPTRNVLSLE
jgi:ribokinase